MSNFLSLLLLLLLLLGGSQNTNISNNLNVKNQPNQVQVERTNQNQNQNQNQESNFEPTAGNRYYIRVILEGIGEDRATSVPKVRLDGNYYCEDGTSGGLRARNVRSFDVTSFTIDCQNPYVELYINHWLSRYVQLTSTDRNNPQDVFFKGGDVNRDNLIDDSDLLGILFNFNRNTSTERELYDVNLDGSVNDEDLKIVNRNFGMRGEKRQFSQNTSYYLRIRLNNVPQTFPTQTLTVNVLCDAYPTTTTFNISNSTENITINLPNQCQNPTAILSLPHFLTKRTNLNSTDPNNPQIVSLINGDTDGNNKIDDVDLLNILFKFGNESSWQDNPRVDLNFDNVVNEQDQNIVLENFGMEGDR
jgi:hypothetical protein